MKNRVIGPAGVALALTLGGSLLAASPSTAAPKTVLMTFKLTNQSGKPLAHVRFSESSGSGSSQVSEFFTTNKHGIGHYQAIANSTVDIFLAGAHHGRKSPFREVWGAIHSIDDSDGPVEELGTYVIAVDSGGSGTTSTFTLPDLVTHRIRVVTRSGKPVVGASVTVKNVSVSGTDSTDTSYRVLTDAYGITTLNGWAMFTTFRADPAAAEKLSSATVNAPSIAYSPTHATSATLGVSSAKYTSKDRFRVVVTNVPHFTNITSHPGSRPGIAVVSATFRQATGVLPNRKIYLLNAAHPNGHALTHGRTNGQGRVTFHLKLPGRERVAFYWAVTTCSPGIVVARPRP